MTRPLATLLFLASLSRGRAQSCGNPQVAGSSPDNSGEHALFDTCATSFDRHCGCNSWDFNKIDGVACYEKGPMQSLADIASPQELRSAPQGHVYAACLPVCACAYMPPSIAIDGSEKLYDWTCSVRAGYSDRCGCARKWKSCSYSGCCSDEGFTCTQRNFNTDMSSPYPGFAQCRKAMKPDGSSPFPNKPSYQQCPDTWACHEADVGQTCFTPFSEKAGLVPKGGPPEDLCDNTCTTYKSFSTKCHDLASPSAGSAYCPLGTDCDRCGSRTTKTLGSYWVLAATHYSTGRRKRSTKQCRQLCAGDVSCKIFYVAFSYAPATTTWTMECYTNQNTAEIELLTDDTMLGLQEDTSAAQATKAVFVKVNCATRKETHPVAKEGYMGGTRSSAPLSRIQHCRKGPCNNPNHWSIMSGSYYYACGWNYPQTTGYTTTPPHQPTGYEPREGVSSNRGCGAWNVNHEFSTGRRALLEKNRTHARNTARRLEFLEQVREDDDALLSSVEYAEENALEEEALFLRGLDHVDKDSSAF